MNTTVQETFVEDMRTVLSEVAPELGARLVPSTPECGSEALVHGHLSREEFAVIYRAARVTYKRRGRSVIACEECCWLQHSTQSKAPVFCQHRQAP